MSVRKKSLDRKWRVWIGGYHPAGHPIMRFMKVGNFRKRLAHGLRLEERRLNRQARERARLTGAATA